MVLELQADEDWRIPLGWWGRFVDMILGAWTKPKVPYLKPLSGSMQIGKISYSIYYDDSDQDQW
jgi:hypothetical protein